jgi:hypothetical protein
MLAVVASMWITFRDYFQIYGQSGDLPYVFQANYTAMGNLIHTLPADERVLISPFDEMPATLTFALHGDDPRVTLYDGRACVVLPDARVRAVSYLVILEDHNTLPTLQLDAPGGRATNTQHFLLYQVPRGSAMQPSPQHALQARWTEPVELLGYDMGQSANGVLPMVFYWRALGQIAEPYTAYVHLVEAGQGESKLMAQHDAPPCNASYVTQNWQVGDVIADHVSLQLPLDLPAGDYELRVGLYHTYLNTRLALASTDRPSQDNEIVVGTVHLSAAQ